MTMPARFSAGRPHSTGSAGSAPEGPYGWDVAEVDEDEPDSVAVVSAGGITLGGLGEPLGLDAGRLDDREFWVRFLDDLRRRGLRAVVLVVSDDFPGLREACEVVFPDAAPSYRDPPRGRGAPRVDALRSPAEQHPAVDRCSFPQVASEMTVEGWGIATISRSSIPARSSGLHV